jgi:hypothetical protein
VLPSARLLATLAIAAALLGCRGGIAVGQPGPGPVVIDEPGHGPPPHAPAHGHRRKRAQGADLRWEPQLGVYAVIGHTDIYFHDDWFIRWSGGWQVSASLGGPWEARSESSIPPGLRAKHPGKKPKHQGRGKPK